MEKLKLKFVLFFASLICPSVVFAQQNDPLAGDHLDLTVYFKGGSTKILMDYRFNRENIQAFVDSVESLKQNPDIQFQRVISNSSASPDSTEQANRNLSVNRTKVVFDYLKPIVPVPESQWDPNPIGENWDGLIKELEESDKSYKYRVLDIIHNVPINNTGGKGRKNQLKDLDDGRVWRDMQRTLFPDLRQATVCLCYNNAKRDTVRITDTVYVKLPGDTVYVKEKKKDVVFALKTNLLYDLFLIPSIGIEIPIGKNFSVAANWSYSWWNNDSNEFYNRVYGGDLDFRYWFGQAHNDRKLAGHHAGVYAQLFTADLFYGKLGMKNGVLVDDWSFAAGLEYGYSLPLNNSLHLDFSIGVGHIWGEYKKYRQVYDSVTDEYKYIQESVDQFPAVFPTKAEVSLVWVLGKMK